jgi:F0F1-type ATP synthase delta subunit
MGLAELIKETRAEKLELLDNTESLKREYNELLKREEKAVEYLDDNSIPLETRENYFSEYKKILDRLNEILELIGRYKREEILEGFKL